MWCLSRQLSAKQLIYYSLSTAVKTAKVHSRKTDAHNGTGDVWVSKKQQKRHLPKVVGIGIIECKQRKLFGLVRFGQRTFQNDDSAHTKHCCTFKQKQPLHKIDTSIRWHVNTVNPKREREQCIRRTQSTKKRHKDPTATATLVPHETMARCVTTHVHLPPQDSRISLLTNTQSLILVARSLTPSSVGKYLTDRVRL